MDRAIKSKAWSASKIIWGVVGLAALALVVYFLMRSPGASSLRIDANRITISRVQVGEFEEYFPFNARVIPLTSVYIDVEQGGRVEEVLVEGGEQVKQGDLILRLSNTNMQRNSIDTETRLLENLDRAQTTQFNRAQSKLQLEDQLLTLDYQILDLGKSFKRYQSLVEQSAISVEEFEDAEDNLNYLKQRRELLQKRIDTENEITERQLAQANDSIERLTSALDLLSASVESLNVRAPISGHLSNVNAQLGENISPGYRIAQVDVLDAFKLRVEIDQYYISDVSLGTIGQLSIGQEELDVEVVRVYSEIVNNVFAVDMAFIGPPLGDLRRGQTLTVELSFSEPVESLMVNKGGFYQETGGRWVYLISEDGTFASRTNIRLGRQNPRYVEVLEGLLSGDRIITSSYEVYNEVETLIFDESIL